jgi:hypothetical protein
MFKLESNFQFVDEDQFFPHFEWKVQRVQQIGGNCNGSSVGASCEWKTFSNLSFMKNKLRSRLNTHLDLCVKMFNQNKFHLVQFIVLWSNSIMEGGHTKVPC